MVGRNRGGFFDLFPLHIGIDMFMIGRVCRHFIKLTCCSCSISLELECSTYITCMYVPVRNTIRTLQIKRNQFIRVYLFTLRIYLLLLTPYSVLKTSYSFLSSCTYQSKHDRSKPPFMIMLSPPPPHQRL